MAETTMQKQRKRPMMAKAYECANPVCKSQPTRKVLNRNGLTEYTCEKCIPQNAIEVSEIE